MAVLEGVAFVEQNALSHFAISDNGALAFLRVPPRSRNRSWFWLIAMDGKRANLKVVRLGDRKTGPGQGFNSSIEIGTANGGTSFP